MQHRIHAIVLVILIGLIGAVLPAGAQYSGSPVPGTLPIPEVPTREQVEEAMDSARFTLGPVRLSPWLSLRNVAWVDPGGTEDLDLTASGGAGAEAFLRLGSKAALSAAALQEYTWWRKEEDRRRWHYQYGLSAFGFFNRLTLRGQVTTADQLHYLYGEVENLISLRDDRFVGQAELDLPGRFGVFALAEARQWQHEADELDFVPGYLLLLDRDESRVRGGVRMDLGRGLSVGLGYETMQTDFDPGAGDRSNSGTAPVVELRLNRAKLNAELHVVYASLDPEADSNFEPFDGSLSRFQIAYKPRGRLEWRLYGYQNLVFSILQESAYYQDDRLGVGASMPLGWRLAATAFVEGGQRDFTGGTGGLADEDLFSYGGALNMELNPRLGLQLGISRTEQDRAVGPDRTVTRVLTGLVLTGFGFGSQGAW